MFSKKATKIDDIFTVDLTLCSKRQINGEEFVNFCGFLKNMNFKSMKLACCVLQASLDLYYYLK